MSACRADLRSLGAHNDMTTVAALPYFHLALLKHLCGLDVLQQGTVALFVTLLDGSHETEFSGQSGESLFLGCLCKSLVHVGPFVVLAFGSVEEVFCCSTDAVMQFFVPQLCMFFLVVSSLLEDSCDLFKTVFLRT